MNRFIILLLTLFPIVVRGDGRDQDICKHTAKISKLKCEQLKLGRRVCENRSSLEFHGCMVGAHSVALGMVRGVAEPMGKAPLEPLTSGDRARFARGDLRVSSQPSTAQRTDLLSRAELLKGLRGKSIPRRVFGAVANLAKVAVLP